MYKFILEIYKDKKYYTGFYKKIHISYYSNNNFYCNICYWKKCFHIKFFVKNFKFNFINSIINYNYYYVTSIIKKKNNILVCNCGKKIYICKHIKFFNIINKDNSNYNIFYNSENKKYYITDIKNIIYCSCVNKNYKSFFFYDFCEHLFLYSILKYNLFVIWKKDFLYDTQKSFFFNELFTINEENE